MLSVEAMLVEAMFELRRKMQLQSLYVGISIVVSTFALVRSNVFISVSLEFVICPCLCSLQNLDCCCQVSYVLLN